MRRLPTLAAIVLTPVLLVLAGCYESEAPLSQPGEVALDPALLGSWRCTPDPPREVDTAELGIFDFNGTEYFAEWREQGAQAVRYRAYGSRVGRHVLLNVIPIADRAGRGRFLFMRYRLDTNGALRLSIAQQDELKGLEGAAALRAIRQRVADDTLYSPWAVCTRMATKPRT